MSSRLYSRGAPTLTVGTDAGTVEVVADYSGDNAVVYVQVHDALTLTAADVPVQATALRRFSNVTTAPIVVEVGCIVAISSTESTYTAITYDDIYNGTTPEDRVSFDVTFTPSAVTVTPLGTDSDRVFDFQFDGDLTDSLGGNPLVKTGGTDLFIPTPSPVRGRGWRASVEHAKMAGNEATLEITGALTVHCWIRFVAAQNAVFLTFGNGASAAAANNHLYTIAATTAGALIWSQENGSGTNTADTSLPLLTAGEWVQVTYTRPTAATSVKLYLDGYLADTSGALTAPTGGTAGILTLGGTEAAVDTPVDVASLTIFNAELTADQVLAHCNRERS